MATATGKVEETRNIFGSDGNNGRSGGDKKAVVASVQQQQCSTAAAASSSTWSQRTKNEASQRSNISPVSNNDSQKSYQFCRICHEGDAGNCSGISPSSSQGSSASRREPLIAPCRCTGSVAMVHLSCLEHWLTMSNSEKCELCNFAYKTKKMPRTWTEFLTESDNQFNIRNMIADLICFFLLTPLLVISTYLCCLGAYAYFIRERWEAVGLVTLSIFLLAVYFTWCHVTLKYHVGVWQTWSRTHQRVRITFGDGSTTQYCRRVSPEAPALAQQQQIQNVRNPRMPSSLSIILEDGNQRNSSDTSSDTTGSSSTAAHQFDYVSILEEDDSYFNYRGRFGSPENLYIVNQNNSYNNRFPCNFNRQQSSNADGSSGVDANMMSRSNIFTYQPVIVIPTSRHHHHQRLLNMPNTAESNFPVMGLSTFTGNTVNTNNYINNNSNNNQNDN